MQINTCSASIVINSVTSQSATEESDTYAIFLEFSGNNSRIIGSHSGSFVRIGEQNYR